MKVAIATAHVKGFVMLGGRFSGYGRWPYIEVDGLRVSVNLEERPLAPTEVAIKNYSECDGMLDALVAAGVVLPPHRIIESGYVELPVCHLAPAHAAQGSRRVEK
jgi:hypothetical protein